MDSALFAASQCPILSYLATLDVFPWTMTTRPERSGASLAATATGAESGAGQRQTWILSDELLRTWKTHRPGSTSEGR